MRITPRTCPVCKSVLDGATQIEGKVVMPEDGDITLCIYCGTCSEFAGDKLRAMTDEEVYDVPMDGRTRRMLIRARELWEKTVGKDSAASSGKTDANKTGD